MNNKQIACNSCGFYVDEAYLHKNKDGKKYCENCRIKIAKAPIGARPVSREEFDKALLVLLNTPPLRLKDLREQLRKEREKKKNSKSKQKSKSKKGSKRSL
jgi:hypothetical protein